MGYLTSTSTSPFFLSFSHCYSDFAIVFLLHNVWSSIPGVFMPPQSFDARHSILSLCDNQSNQWKKNHVWRPKDGHGCRRFQLVWRQCMPSGGHGEQRLEVSLMLQRQHTHLRLQQPSQHPRRNATMRTPGLCLTMHVFSLSVLNERTTRLIFGDEMMEGRSSLG